MKHYRHYLYGRQCTVYTDHEALKSLLNTPYPSGKLAPWGMALQELDLKVEYRPGKTNSKADALSRYPVSLLTTDYEDTQAATLVARVVGSGLDAESDEEMALSERQHKDKELVPILRYLQSGNYQKT